MKGPITMFLAQEFDAESDGQPFISAHRRRLIAPDTRSRVYGYLATAPEAAPGYRTDGVWVWPYALAGHVLSRGAAPQEQLFQHMREQYFLLPEALAPGAIERAAEAARGAVIPDPPPPDGTFIGRFTSRDAEPTCLLHLVRGDGRPNAEYCYFQDGWDPSDVGKRTRHDPQATEEVEFREISERAAAQLVNRLTDTAHRRRLERAQESEDTCAPLRLARVYDGESPAGEPWFSPGRLRSPEPGRRERLAAYLSRGRLVVRATGRMVDPLDPSGGPVVPLGYRTDGTWVWQEALAYYVRSRGVAPEMALLCHIEERGFTPTDVPDDLASVAVAAVRAGPAPAPLRPPMLYYQDSSGSVARAVDGSFLDADLLARDLRWCWTDALYKQRYQGSDDDFAQISEEAAVAAIDARWAAGGAVPPFN